MQGQEMLVPTWSEAIRISLSLEVFEPGYWNPVPKEWNTYLVDKLNDYIPPAVPIFVDQRFLHLSYSHINQS